MAYLQPVSHDLLVMYTAMDQVETPHNVIASNANSPLGFSSPSLPRKQKSASFLSDSSSSLSHGSLKFYKLQSTAQKKLIQASAICALFMIIESVAGIWSNSLALLTDASHLLSDLSSFLISLFALWVATLPGTHELSFGYHRAEILGALISVAVIWILTVFLLIEAYKRLSAPSPVNGGVMFVTAFFGTLANLVMTYILGIHTHGIKSHCSENHHHHHHHQHQENKSVYADFEDKKKSGEEPDESETALTTNPSKGDPEAGLNSPVTIEKRSESQHQDSWLSHLNTPSSTVHNNSVDVPSYQDATYDDLVPSHDGSFISSLLKPEVQNLQKQSLKSLIFPVVERESRESFVRHDQANVNLRAAYLHAAGDLIQNIGVLLAATLIWFKPSWSIVDPLCTFFFSLLVLGTTISILLEAMNVLMEGVPKEVNLYHLKKDLQEIPSVTEIHDLHVWSLSLGKPSLACHIVVDLQNEARRVLRKATEVCQKKYGILHTTIQIDYSANKQSCDTDAHTKCH